MRFFLSAAVWPPPELWLLLLWLLLSVELSWVEESLVAEDSSLELSELLAELLEDELEEELEELELAEELSVGVLLAVLGGVEGVAALVAFVHHEAVVEHQELEARDVQLAHLQEM